MPFDRDIARAIEQWHDLDRQAEAGWPNGYDAETVAREADDIVAVLAAAVAVAPPTRRSSLAVELIRAGQTQSLFQATIEPRRRVSPPSTEAP
jgi:hypothetical protein